MCKQDTTSKLENLDFIINDMVDIGDMKFSTHYNARLTKDLLISSLGQTDESPWKHANFASASGFSTAIQNTLPKRIIEHKKKIGCRNFDIYFLGIYGLRYCSHCDKCLPLEDFNNRISNSFGVRNSCRCCENDSKRIARKQNFQRLIDLLLEDGRKIECVKCGYNTNWAALQLHHEDKSIRPSWAFTKSGLHAAPSHYLVDVSDKEAKKRFLVEKDNLILLCSNCHLEEHNPNQSLDNYII